MGWIWLWATILHHLLQTQSSQLPTASRRPKRAVADGLVLGPAPHIYGLCCSLVFLCISGLKQCSGLWTPRFRGPSSFPSSLLPSRTTFSHSVPTSAHPLGLSSSHRQVESSEPHPWGHMHSCPGRSVTHICGTSNAIPSPYADCRRSHPLYTIL